MRVPAANAAFAWTSEAWGYALRSRMVGAAAQHLFTSKQLGLPSPQAWSAALGALGASSDRLMRVKQIHGNVVRILKKGEVPEDASEQKPDGDAIVSNQPGLVLAVVVADCVPILVVDPVGGAAAAIHAGWRGTCAGVARIAIETMRRECGSNPAGLIAAIGPSAGPEDYEVGESVADAFVAAGHPATDVNRWFIRSGARPHLDLWSANRDQLIAAGLDSARITESGLSTIAHPDIFDSYRVSGERAGRMAALIVVPPAAPLRSEA